MGTGGSDEGAGSTAAAGDDAAAFAAAYRLLAPQVRGYARRQVPDGLAEDVVSETFLVLWRRWADAPSDPDHLRPWVFGVARNKILHVREQHGRSVRSLARAAALEPTRPGAPDPGEELAAADRARRLLELLPPTEGEAMALTVWAGLTPSEAAEVLGVSLTALTSRLSRARARLAVVLAGTDGGDARPHDPARPDSAAPAADHERRGR
ncbi:sigma-70 family RNA polymerase sigma factor [Cellulomonas hominis]|uniref:sigma-70 family RNA polymerase sigma factor n=1 Tax=Cellulomonas hominis TaxID=156981 RepID=UPI001443EF1B|nr:sigma-70 family RNA polymerase sigma factor [Cellulomonas hominis]